MADDKKTVLTPIFRASFVHIFQPQDDDEGNQIYSVQMIFAPDVKESKEFKAMQRLAKEAKEAKFGANAGGKFKSPFRMGTVEEYGDDLRPEYKGNIIVPARSKNRQPGIIDRNRVRITSANEFFSGCYAMAKVSAYGYDFKGNKGVSFGLSSLLMVKKGEPLISISNPEEDFAEIDTSQWDDEDTDLFESGGGSDDDFDF